MSANTQLTTPTGTLIWPSLTEPDMKFDAAGTYSTRIMFEAGAEADALEATLARALAAAVEDETKRSGGKKVKTSPSLPYSRNEEGKLVVKAKLRANVETKSGKTWVQRPALFDSRGTKLEGDIRVGNGSRARLAVEITSWNQPGIGGVGLSLRLRGVQIIELREGMPSSASDFGFGATDAGFTTETFSDFDEDKKPSVAKEEPKQESLPKKKSPKAQDF